MREFCVNRPTVQTRLAAYLEKKLHNPCCGRGRRRRRHRRLRRQPTCLFIHPAASAANFKALTYIARHWGKSIAHFSHQRGTHHKAYRAHRKRACPRSGVVCVFWPKSKEIHGGFVDVSPLHLAQKGQRNSARAQRFPNFLREPSSSSSFKNEP